MQKITIIKQLILGVLLFISLPAFTQYDSIPFGAFNRTYLLHLPDAYKETSSLPLLIAMHGGFGNAYNIEKQSQLSVKADAENFIVVYPEGIKSGLLNISSWNAGWCCGFASRSNVDDVGFINSLLDTLIDQYTIDTNRIYATGMSNGGFMAYRLACELSQRIAAIAPVAASMSMSNCTPIRPVPIIDFHSYMDTHIPYDGGVGNGPSNHYNSPQDSVLNAWAKKGNCSSINDTIVNNSEYTFIKWSVCDCTTEIHHYATQDGGHSWPGGVQTLIGDPVSNYINATDLMWEFFQQHSLDCKPLSEKRTVWKENNIKIFPNPTSGKLTIYTEGYYQKLEIEMFNLAGEKILSSNQRNKIELSHLKLGAYFIKVNMDGNIKMEKIIKTE